MTASQDVTGEVTRADPIEFRRILGHFCTGVVVVTAYGDRPVGMTCQSFSSLSLDPPLVLFSPARTSTTWPLIRGIGRFAINILSAEQESICRRFAVSGGDKFADVLWKPGLTGSPLLDGAVAHLECVLHEVLPGGDHDIVIGRPVAVGQTASLSPLLFFQSRYGTFDESPHRPAPHSPDRKER
ncbi:flavin reductase family protein [soil metagenome]|jgi:3-hydroxy-9,10-secoandrosta-1,3,5(10)-triene-9,17-dione monooxygenase reductase component